MADRRSAPLAPRTAHPAGRLRALGPFVPVGVLCALAALVIDRPGYSPDEEITAVVATAIGSSGIPLLPSGVVYNRGVPYLYLAWLTGASLGPSIVAWRLASLLCACAGLVFAFRLGSMLGGAASGLLLAMLLAALPPYVAASVFARQYSALAACALLFVWLFAQWMQGRRSARPALLALACASLLHPLGMALAGLPVVTSALEGGAQRAVAMRFALRGGAVVALVSLVSYGIHLASLALAGITVSADTAIYAIPRFSTPPPLHAVALAGAGSWIAAVAVVGLAGSAIGRLYPVGRTRIAVTAACALTFQLGVMLLVCTAAMILRRNNARAWLVCGIVMTITSVAWWSIHTAAMTDAEWSWALTVGLTRASAAYPWGHVWLAAGAFPALAALALLGCAAAVLKPQSDSTAIIRGLVVLTLVLLGGFAVAPVPVAERYLLLPFTLSAIVAAYGVTALPHLMSQAGLSLPAARRLGTGIAVCALIWFVEGIYRYGPDRDTIAPVSVAQQWLAPPTGASWNPGWLRPLVTHDDILVCTEELACLYFFGRLDYLFALTPADVAHYVVTRTAAPIGFYAGAPVLSSRVHLEETIRAPTLPGCVVVVSLRTGKVGFDEYNSAVAFIGSQFETRVLFSTDDTRVSRICKTA